MRTAAFEGRLNDAAADTPSPDQPRSRLAELLSGLKDDAATLARQEAVLAKKELVSSMKEVVKDSGGMAAGGVVMAAGGALLLLAAGFGLSAAIAAAGLGALPSLALGFLSAALLALLLGGLVLYRSAARLKDADLVPTHTGRALRYAAKLNLDGPEVQR